MAKNIIYGTLACLCVVLISILAFPKHKKTHKKKRHISEQITSKQVEIRLPNDLPFDKINGKNRNKIIEQIRSFPINSYQLFLVPKNGYFYLDGINDLIKTRLKQGRVWEEPIQKLIHQYASPGSTVLDIGAHIGTHTLTMAQAVGPHGQVIAFEPQPKIFTELFLNMGINNLRNISFYWAGVGDHEGNIELGLLHEFNEGGAHLVTEEGLRMKEVVGTGHTVQLLTIDSLHLSNVSLMKIDVEGMEEEVLDGARETILTNRPIILLEIMGGSEFGQASQDVRHKMLHTIDKLEQLKYRVTQYNADWIAIPN